ncbi:MAG: hypothetical protein ACI9QQ_000941 [Myxococcota bacterium]
MKLRITAVVIAILLLAARIALPTFLQSKIEQLATDALGVPVTLGNVDLALLAGQASIEEFSIGAVPAAGDTRHAPFLEFDALVVRVDLFASLIGDLRVEKVELSQPTLRLRQLIDGQLDAVVLAKSASANTKSEGQYAPKDAVEKAEEPAPIRIDNISLNNLEFEFQNLATTPATPIRFASGQLTVSDIVLSGGAFSIGGVSLENGQLSFHGKAPLVFAINATSENITNAMGEAFPIQIQTSLKEPAREGLDPLLALKGEFAIHPLAFEGRLEYRALPLADLVAPFDVGPGGEWLRSGDASGQLSIKVATSTTNDRDINVTGDLNIVNFDVADQLEPEAREVALGWKSLSVQLREASLQTDAEGALRSPPSIRLSEIAWVEPTGRFTNASPSLDAFSASDEDGDNTAAADQEPTDASQAPSIRVDYVKIDRGRFEFIDPFVSPRFHDGVENLNLEASRIDSSTLTIEKLLLSFASNKAVLSVDGGVGDGRALAVDVEELELAPFNAYALTHAGYVIKDGRFSLHTTVEQNDADLAVQNAITFHDLDVEDGSNGGFKDQFGVSLPMGLALLRDTEGNISLDVPLDVKGGETELNVGAIALQAMQAAMLGAITSPLKMLYAAVPGNDDGASVPLVLCTPTEIEFAEESQELIERIAEMLKARPSLALSMRGQVGPLDRPEGMPEGSDNGGFDALAAARVAGLTSLLMSQYSIPEDQLRVDPQVPVGTPGVLIAWVAR